MDEPSQPDPQQPSRAGFGIYNRFVLRFYDWLVPGLLNRFVWKCPSKHQRAMYERYVQPRHLDVGVGTGYYLKALLKSDVCLEEIVLVDANQNCLDHASRMLGGVTHKALQWNVMQPLPSDSHPFLDGCQSASATYLFHCLPLGMESAHTLVETLAKVLGDDGVFFGSTITADMAGRRFLPRTIMKRFQRMQIFGNQKDTADGLRQLLSQHFAHVELTSIDCVTMFVASQNKR